MIEVIVFDKPPAEIMEIVRELRMQGLVQHKDFDFEYHQAQVEYMTYEVYRRHTIFKFHTEKYATLFALKYVS